MTNNGQELIDYIVEQLNNNDERAFDSSIVNYLRGISYLEWQRLFTEKDNDN